MVTVLKELKYTRDHEWARVQDSVATVGLTDFAQEQLGDIVFVELPEVGTEIKQSEAFGAIESVKAATDMYAPVSGVIKEVNENLRNQPELINESPYDDGWMVKIDMSDDQELETLMSSTEYEQLLASAS